MKDHQVEKKFIHLPQFPGGKTAFQEFIRTNLRYPKEALENKIEGTVHVLYHVDGLGNVLDCLVTRGIGYGCDEEAVRIIMMMKYEKAKNRGLRVTAAMRTRISFKLPKTTDFQIEYSLIEKPGKDSQVKPTKPAAGESYGYTISF